MCNAWFYLTFLFTFGCVINGLPDEGKWDYNLTSEYNSLVLLKSLYKGAQVFIQINCEAPSHDLNISINLVILPSHCWDFSNTVNEAKDIVKSNQISCSSTKIYRFGNSYKCDDPIFLDGPPLNKEKSLYYTHPIYVILHDGVYMLVFKVTTDTNDFNVGVHIEMKSDYGSLSAADWPLLPFYGFMCIFYVILGLELCG